MVKVNPTRKVVIATFFKAEKNANGLMGAEELVAFMDSINKKISLPKAQKMIEVSFYGLTLT